MATEQEFAASIAAQKAAYAVAHATETRDQLAARSANIRADMDALCVLLRGDAKACPVCGEMPIGMLKTPAHTHKGKAVRAVYAVRCINPAHPLTMSCGRTPQAAALLWNNGEIEG